MLFCVDYTIDEVKDVVLGIPKYLFLSKLAYKINPILPFRVQKNHFIFAALKIRVLTHNWYSND